MYTSSYFFFFLFLLDIPPGGLETVAVAGCTWLRLLVTVAKGGTSRRQLRGTSPGTNFRRSRELGQDRENPYSRSLFGEYNTLTIRLWIQPQLWIHAYMHETAFVHAYMHETAMFRAYMHETAMFRSYMHEGNVSCIYA